jgi:hypothetical protein
MCIFSWYSTGKHQAFRFFCKYLVLFGAAQRGQPLPLTILLCGSACHSWEQIEQSHQRFILELILSFLGFTLPFLVLCHSFTKCGATVEITFVIEVRLSEQKGQPVL